MSIKKEGNPTNEDFCHAPSQSAIQHPGGGVELRMKLSSLAEVERWILGWAGNARVLHPPALAESVRQSAKNILRNFPPSAGACPGGSVG